MGTEELKTIVECIQSLGGEAKTAFIVYIIARLLEIPMIGLVIITSIYTLGLTVKRIISGFIGRMDIVALKRARYESAREAWLKSNTQQPHHQELYGEFISAKKAFEEKD